MVSYPWQKPTTATPAQKPAAAVAAACAAPMPARTQPDGAAPLTIVRLTAENVKRLRAVSIEPDGALVVLGGRNAQGKTSK